MKTYIFQLYNSLKDFFIFKLHPENLLDTITQGYVILSLLIVVFLGLRTISFGTYQDEWSLNAIYDCNNNIIAMDIQQCYIELDGSPEEDLLENYLTKQEIELLLSGKPVPIDKSIPRIKGTKQFRSRKRMFKPYSTSIAYSDVDRGMKKGLDILSGKSKIYTTIDLNKQIIIGKIIEDGVKEMNADGGFGFIVHIETGAIEALYTSDAPSKEKVKDFTNPVLCLYEFGSILKVITAFTGLLCNKITLDEQFPICQGVMLGGRPMVDVEYIPPYANVSQILKVSSNIGTIMIAKKIGPEVLLNTLKSLGLMEVIHTDFVTTLRPQIPKDPKPVDILSMAFGYSLNTSPLNIIRAFLTIFNNGYEVTPYLFKNTRQKPKATSLCANKNLNWAAGHSIRLMKEPASKYAVFVKFECAAKTGTSNRVERGVYNHDSVNTFNICAIPNRQGKYVKLLFFGLLNPRNAKLAGLTVRKLMGLAVNNIAPLIY